MNRKIEENISEVREEAWGVLDNIAKVRGPKYASVVRSLLLASNLASIQSLSMKMGGLPDEVRGALGEGMFRATHGILLCVASLAGLSEEEMADATRDATAIESSVSGLMENAIKTGLRGGSFGSSHAE